ncbi:MAG: hypothetical protein R2697_17125 [Ilumatobacteraceae bacterium]
MKITPGTAQPSDTSSESAATACEVADRERGETRHEGELALAEQRGVADDTEDRTDDQPRPDIGRRIAERRRHADEQRHRERLGDDLDRTPLTCHRPPVDEGDDRRCDEEHRTDHARGGYEGAE